MKIKTTGVPPNKLCKSSQREETSPSLKHPTKKRMQIVQPGDNWLKNDPKIQHEVRFSGKENLLSETEMEVTGTRYKHLQKSERKKTVSKSTKISSTCK